MAKSRRLFNADFMNDSPTKRNLSNKAILMYCYLMFNTDDRGFVGNAPDLADYFDLKDMKEKRFDPERNYSTAIDELLEKGFLFGFKDRHGNVVHLVRHYWMHNKIPEKRITNCNFSRFLDYVDLKANTYEWKPNVTQVSNICDTNVCVIEEKRIKENLSEGNINEENLKERNPKEGDGKPKAVQKLICSDEDFDKGTTFKMMVHKYHEKRKNGIKLSPIEEATLDHFLERNPDFEDELPF